MLASLALRQQYANWSVRAALDPDQQEDAMATPLYHVFIRDSGVVLSKPLPYLDAQAEKVHWAACYELDVDVRRVVQLTPDARRVLHHITGTVYPTR